MRLLSLALGCAAYLLMGTNPQLWNAWLFTGGDLVRIDAQGVELDRQQIPILENYTIAEWSIAHKGRLFAYIIENFSQDDAQLWLYDIEQQHVLWTFDLNDNSANLLYGYKLLIDSQNFRMDDGAIAIGYEVVSGGWQIVVLDTSSGQILHQVSNNDVPVYMHNGGTFPIIYRFEGDILSFALAPYAIDLDTPIHDWSINWSISDNTFSYNCRYRTLYPGIYTPTGEAVETGIYPFLDEAPDSDIITDGRFVLERYNPDTQARDVFFQSPFPLFNPAFVQNGERLVVLGKPQELHPMITRLMLIERDGTLVDQFDIEGIVRIIGTADGFLYTAFNDVEGAIPTVRLVNSRTAAPFASQQVIFESEPTESVDLLWTNDTLTNSDSLATAWGNRAVLQSDCPPFRG